MKRKKHLKSRKGEILESGKNSNIFRKTSRPKARDGHRYPCPAEQFVYGSLLGKQGFVPLRGRSPVEHRGNLYVRTKSPETAAGRPEPAP